MKKALFFLVIILQNIFFINILVDYNDILLKDNNKIKNIVNVKDFGAKGKYGEDDSEAFKRSIEYIENIGGGEIIIPYTDEAYILNSSIIISGEYQIIFKGISKPIIKINTSSEGIVIGDSSWKGMDIRFENIYFSGNRFIKDQSLIYCNNVSYVEFINCHFNEAGKYGLIVESPDINLYNCKFTNFTNSVGAGIIIGSENSSKGSNVTIENIHLQNNNIGLLVKGYPIDKVKIIDGVIQGNSQGIKIDCDYPMVLLTIEDVFFENNKEYIKISKNKGVQIKNLTIENNQLYMKEDELIELNNIDTLFINNNYISAPKHKNIKFKLNDKTNNVMFINNRFEGYVKVFIKRKDNIIEYNNYYAPTVESII